jgi:arylsulfatase A-like enzyme
MPSSSISTRQASTRSNWSLLPLFAATAGVLVVLIDTVPGLLLGRIPDSLRLLCLPLAFTAGSAFIAYALLFAVLSPFARSSREPGFTFHLSLVSFLTVLAAFGVLSDVLAGKDWRAQSVFLLGGAFAALAAGTTTFLAVPHLGWTSRPASSVWLRAGLVSFLLILLSPCALFVRGEGAANDHVGATKLHPRTILLITIDSLRHDRVTCAGSGRLPTPSISQLCDGAVVFTNARSPAPWTLPAFVSMMTGVSPLVHRATTRRSALPSSLPTLAEILRDTGYRTRATVVNSFLRPSSKLSRGFVHYSYFPRTSSMASVLGKRVWARLFPRLVRFDATTEQLTDLAVQTLHEGSDVPLFLWVHYLDPHIPYAPPSSWLNGAEPPSNMRASFGKKERLPDIRAGYLSFTAAERRWIENLYEAEIRYVDEGVGRILNTLRELDLYDDALIILTSDHGEEFWEHGGFEHGHTVYDELLRVPLVVKPPSWHGARAVDQPVSTQSLFATILDLAGIENAAIDTTASLRPLWSAGGADQTTSIVIGTGTVYYEDRIALVFERYKYIRSLVTGSEELYSLTADPGEQRPLVGEQSELLRARELLEREMRREEQKRLSLGLTETGEKAALDSATREQLRALGYER